MTLTASSAAFIKSVFERVRRSLDPLEGALSSSLKEECKRRAKSGLQSSKEDDLASNQDPLSRAMVLDLALNVIANELDQEEEDSRVDELQLLIAIAAKEKDRALGKLKDVSRTEYADMKTEILSLVIGSLLPQSSPSENFDSRVDRTSSLRTDGIVSDRGSMISSGGANAPVSMPTNHREFTQRYLIDEEVVRFAPEEKRSSVLGARRGSFSSQPEQPIEQRPRRDSFSSHPDLRRLRSRPAPSFLPEPVQERRRASVSSETSQEGANLNVYHESDQSARRNLEHVLHEDPTRPRGPVMRTPLSNVRASQLNNSAQSGRKKTTATVVMDEADFFAQRRSTVSRRAPGPTMKVISLQNTRTPDEYEKEREALLKELHRTREDHKDMCDKEEHMAAELALLVEELQSRVVEVQRRSQESLAIKEEELALMQKALEEKKDEIASLKENLAELGRATTKDFEDEIRRLTEDFERERVEWERMRVETEHVIKNMRVSLENRFEKEKELAVMAATENAMEMAADEMRIQLEEFEARLEREVKETKRNLFDGFQLEMNSLKDGHKRQCAALEAELAKARADQEFLAQLGESSASLESELAQQAQRALTLETELNQSKTERERLKAELEARVLASQEECRALSIEVENQRTSSSNAFQALKDQNEGLSLEVTALRQANHDLKRQLDQIQQTVGADKQTLRAQFEQDLSAEIVQTQTRFEAEKVAMRAAFDAELDGVLESSDQEKQDLMERLSSEFHRQLGDLTHENQSLRSDIQRLEQAIESLRLQLSQKSGEAEELRMARMQADAEAIALKARLEQLSKEADHAANLRSQVSEIEVLKGQLATAEEATSLTRSQLASMETQLSSLQAVLDDHVAKCTGLASKLSVEQTKSVDLQAVLSSEQARSAQLQAYLFAEQEKSAELQTALSSEQAKSAESQGILVQEQTLSAQLQVLLDEEQTKSGQLETFLIEEQTKIAQLEAAYKTRMAELEASLAKAQQLLEHQANPNLDKVANLERQLQQTRETLVEERNRIMDLESLLSQNETVAAEVETLKKERVDLSGMIASLLKEHEQTERDMAQLTQERDSLKEQLYSVSTASTASSEDIEALRRSWEEGKRAEMDTLKREMEAQRVIEMEAQRRSFGQRLDLSVKNAVESSNAMCMEVFEMEKEELLSGFEAEKQRRDAELASVKAQVHELQRRPQTSEDSASSSFELMKLATELRIAREQSRLATEKLDLETRRLRSEMEHKLKEAKKSSDVSPASDSAMEAEVLKEALEAQRIQFETEMQQALTENNTRWEEFVRQQQAQRNKDAEENEKDLPNRSVGGPSGKPFLRSRSDPLALTQQQMQHHASDWDEQERISKLAASLRRSMDSIIVILKEAGQVSMETGGKLRNVNNSGETVDDILQAVMRERAVFAKALLHLNQAKPALESTADKDGSMHTPLAERRTIVPSVPAVDTGAGAATGYHSTSAAGPTTDAQELEMAVLDEVELL